MRTLHDLGLGATGLTRLRDAIHRAWGLVVATGPTGSGKSTTLYAAVSELNDRERNVVTIEDPVEYLIAGVKQMQVNRRAGVTFARALRSILRADPDVVLVGEIRDEETARLAAEAALTGHLVLSTLHTNDAASTPMRLLEMGVEPYLVTSALDCVVAQRLVRRLCDECRVAAAPAVDQLRRLGIDERCDRVFLAHGCAACEGTGYRGRFAVYEVMPIDDTVRGLVVSRAAADEIRAAAIAAGMETMLAAGAARVVGGDTSPEELLRVLR